MLEAEEEAAREEERGPEGGGRPAWCSVLETEIRECRAGVSSALK